MSDQQPDAPLTLNVRPGPKLSYETGDTVFIYVGLTDANKNPVLSEGRVVSWLDLPDFGQRYYVIQMRDPEWIVLELRDALLMTDSPTGELPFRRTQHSSKLPADSQRSWRGTHA